MALVDLGALVRVEHETRQAAHMQVTQATTRMHMDADAAEGRGAQQQADDLRAAAEAVQAEGNKRWRPRSN